MLVYFLLIRNITMCRASGQLEVFESDVQTIAKKEFAQIRQGLSSIDPTEADIWAGSSIGIPFVQWELVEENMQLVPLSYVVPVIHDESIVGLLGFDCADGHLIWWTCSDLPANVVLSYSRGTSVLQRSLLQYGLPITSSFQWQKVRIVLIRDANYFLIPQSKTETDIYHISNPREWRVIGVFAPFEFSALEDILQRNIAFSSQSKAIVKEPHLVNLAPAVPHWQGPAEIPSSVTRMEGKVPYYDQIGFPYWCAVYCLAMMFRWWVQGSSTINTGDQDAQSIASFLHINSSQGINIFDAERVVRDYFGWPSVWMGEMKPLAQSGTSWTMDDIKADIAADGVVLVTQYATPANTTIHGRIVLGYWYQFGHDVICVHDPGLWLGWTYDATIVYSLFEDLWTYSWFWPFTRGGVVGFRLDQSHPEPTLTGTSLDLSGGDGDIFEQIIAVKNTGGETACASGVHVRFENAIIDHIDATGWDNTWVSADRSIAEFYVGSVPVNVAKYAHVYLKPTALANVRIKYRNWVSSCSDVVHCWFTTHRHTVLDDRASHLGPDSISVPNQENAILRAPVDEYNDRDNFLDYPVETASITVSDDDTSPPDISSPSHSGDIFDSYSGSYRIQNCVTDASGLSSVEFRYKFGSSGAWSSWRPYSGSSGCNYYYDISRSEWVAGVGLRVYWQCRATDNDNDRPNDQLSSTSSEFQGGTISDDDVSGPSYSSLQTSPSGSVYDSHNSYVRIQGNVSDPSGIYSVEFMHGYGFIADIYTPPTGSSGSTYWYDIPRSEWINHVGENVVWRIEAYDNDNDRPNDRSYSISDWGPSVQILDDDVTTPSISSPSHSGDVPDSYSGSYRIQNCVSDASGLSSVEFSFKFGSSGSLSSWRPYSGYSGCNYYYDIPRNEWVTGVGQQVYWKCRATDNDNDRDGDQLTTTSGEYSGGLIYDDDTQGPSFVDNWDSGDAPPGPYYFKVKLNDGSGILDDNDYPRVYYRWDNNQVDNSNYDGFADADWDGVWYTASINVGADKVGHTIYWRCLAYDNDNDRNDDRASSWSPAPSYLGGTITSGNNPPVLSWTGEPNYVSDGLHPETGNSSTDFIYRVTYTDSDNDAPKAGYPKVHIVKGGVEISGSPYTMSAADGNAYNVGRKYTFTKNGLSDGTDYTYYFEAYDVNNVQASGVPTGPIDAPDVSTTVYRNVTITTNIGSGTKVRVNGVEYNAPKTFTDWPSGEGRTISVDSPQSGGTNKRYVFSSWSDAGSQSHLVTPTSDSIYTAQLITEWKPTITLNGTDAEHTVSVQYTKDGSYHDEPGKYTSWSDWCDDGTDLSFSQSTTGTPPRFTTAQRSWTVNSAFSATINYVEQPECVIYVDSANTSGIEDGSWDHPFNTIQEGIDSAEAMCTVYVAAGTYHENIVLKSGVSVYGEDPSNCSIVGVASGNGVVYGGVLSNVEFAGFRITVDVPVQGIDIGICLCYHQDSTVRICRNVIIGTQIGIVVWTGNPIIQNNTFFADYDETAIWCNHSSPLIINNIIVGYYFSGILVLAMASPVIRYNNLFGNATNYMYCSAGPGDISVDPLFVNAGDGDFHLQSSSPCINAGDPNPNYNDPDGTRNDMGAFYHDATWVHDEHEEKNIVGFSLSQNYPNPFNPQTTIEYQIPKESWVTLEIYNTLGQRIRQLFNGRMEKGHHQVTWDGKDNNGADVGNGIYFYRIKAGEFSDVKKMVLLK